MALFKCKMCGGALEVLEGASVMECEYCGTQQTLPKLDDDRRVNLYDRANHFRRNNEFDKAMGIYEQILNEDKTDAEAYWSLVLCRYGIEYVEDPATHKRIPTVNRAQFTSVFDDDNYKSALQYADSIQRGIYDAEAKAINEIQKGILAISQKEEPFDVFICYKESDNNGRRTPDSVLANDLYHQLTQEGFKVFFSRITLEDKLGTAYEPYIFAALNSAKVMVALGTKPEYFKAVWVKNEWSRYLSLIKNGAHKILIPAYKDMDPYDLPEEFSHLQAQDMSKLGFMQDLIRGIKKLTQTEAPTSTTVVKETVINASGNNTAPLLKRVFMFLEDGDWIAADEYCEKVLDIDPECAEAYVGKLMAELKAHTQEDLKICEKPFDCLNNYKKAVRFGDDKLKDALMGYIDHINVQNMEKVYTAAKILMEETENEALYEDAAKLFDCIPHYKDASSLAEQCREKADTIKKDKILSSGKKHLTDSSSYSSIPQRIKEAEKAIEIFETIPGWKDADECERLCKEKIEEWKAEEEAEKEAKKEKERRLIEEQRQQREKKRKELNRRIRIIAVALCIVFAFMVVLVAVIIPNGKYNDAVALMEVGKYEEAVTAFEALEGHKDSIAKIEECQTAILDRKYNDAVALMEEGKYEEAITAFEAIQWYKDSVAKIEKCRTAILDRKYNDTVALMEEGKYEDAITAFRVLGEHKDSKAKIEECQTAILDRKYNDAVALTEAGKHGAAMMVFASISDYKDARSQFFALWEKIANRETVSASDIHTVGLKSDGTVVAVGSNSWGQCDVSSWTDIVAVSARLAYTVGLKSDGTVVAVGNNEYGQCDVSSWTDIVAVSTGYYHTVGLKSDGTVVAVNSYDWSQCDVSSWTDIVAVSAGADYTVGLKSDGTVVAVGSNYYGKCDVSSWTDIVAVSARDNHTVGLKSDGTVVAVGDNEYGQCDVSSWTDIVAISAGRRHTIGLKSDGTVVAVGYNDDGQCDVSSWTDIVAVSAGADYTVGLKSDGTVVAVGDNYYGQCTVSSWTDIKLPN